MRKQVHCMAKIPTAKTLYRNTLDKKTLFLLTGSHFSGIFYQDGEF